jgi:hypothetical protein
MYPQPQATMNKLPIVAPMRPKTQPLEMPMTQNNHLLAALTKPTPQHRQMSQKQK